MNSVAVQCISNMPRSIEQTVPTAQTTSWDQLRASKVFDTLCMRNQCDTGIEQLRFSALCVRQSRRRANGNSPPSTHDDHQESSESQRGHKPNRIHGNSLSILITLA
jgi:hypothetical protein